MHTGENEQGLRKILDMTRFISIVLLVLHIYYYCYRAFDQWHWTTSITDQLLANVHRTGLFEHFHTSKWWTLAFLMVSLIGTKGRKDEKLTIKIAVAYIVPGVILYFASYVLIMTTLPIQTITITYIVATGLGYLLILTGGTYMSRIIRMQMDGQDVFNKANETFPQEERWLHNAHSINLPARYYLKNKVRSSWINVINPFRSLMVMGSPGSGKSYFVIRHVITQHLGKGFSMFIYDFKFDDLTVIAYNHFLKHQNHFPVPLSFYVINFDDLSRSHRCNPLEKENMTDITDAAESARTILLGLNREWIRKQGDFFVESPINFLTAIIWFLRKYRDAEFLSVPHAIELAQYDYDRLFSILRSEKEIEVLINPFVSAYLNDAMEQLEGQVASAKIALARLASPQLYYILSGNDFTLDINNPEAPKVVCMGNNPQKAQTYGAVLSLYVNRLIKLVNKKGKLKSSLIFDEFPTIFLNHVDSLIATARSNQVATCLGIQDFSQLKKDYGKDQADVIMNITGNIISGQVSGETAKQLSERFGKIMQDRSSLSVNSSDTSISKSRQLDHAIPPSAIASLSSGQFVGMVADDPIDRIELKTFHNEIVNNHDALKKEQQNYKPIPLIREVTQDMVQSNFLQIKLDVENLVLDRLSQMMSDPAKATLIIKKSLKV
jgi:hypothetical protein